MAKPRLVLSIDLTPPQRNMTPEEQAEFDRRRALWEPYLKAASQAAEDAERLTAADWNLRVY